MSLSTALTPLRDRATTASRPALTLAPSRRPRTPRVPFVILLTAVLIGGVVGLLMFNTSLQQASFAVSSLEAQAQTLTAREQSLRMELDALRDPQRVALSAQQMGMVPAGTPAFLDLRTGKIKGVPTPATRENAVRIQQLPPRKPARIAPAPKIREVVADTASSTARSERRRGHDGNRKPNSRR